MQRDVQLLTTYPLPVSLARFGFGHTPEVVQEYEWLIWVDYQKSSFRRLVSSVAISS
jgi:hypothetical protein